MEAPTDSVAGRWFDVRATYEEPSTAKQVGTALKTVLLGIVTVGLSMLGHDPKQRCTIQVIRRDNGSRVLLYTYDSAAEASNHAQNLRERLWEQRVFDFCHTTGIPVDHVAGPGTDFDQDAPFTWVRTTPSTRW